jgi:hypothetical protein
MLFSDIEGSTALVTHLGDRYGAGHPGGAPVPGAPSPV